MTWGASPEPEWGQVVFNPENLVWRPAGLLFLGLHAPGHEPVWPPPLPLLRSHVIWWPNYSFNSFLPIRFSKHLNSSSCKWNSPSTSEQTIMYAHFKNPLPAPHGYRALVTIPPIKRSSFTEHQLGEGYFSLALKPSEVLWVPWEQKQNSVSWQWIRVLTLHPFQHKLSFILLILATLAGIKWNLKIVLICVSLMVKDIELYLQKSSECC